MKLKELLYVPGTHVWLFGRETDIKDVANAHRRLQSYLQQDKHRSTVASAMGVLVTNPKTCETEHALVVEVTIKP